LRSARGHNTPYLLFFLSLLILVHNPRKN
jgi:hypothetical protein